MLRRLGVAVTAALLGITMLAEPAQAADFNVRDYGAAGNGSANDTAAIDRAITAANAAGGGTVRFPSGTYRSPNSIHMKSNVTLQLDSGATIMGASGNGYDKPEPNPNDEYQDYGHSHFHNAMIWGDRLTNIGFVGSGTIDGGGALITGNPDSGQADKIISLTRCDEPHGQRHQAPSRRPLRDADQRLPQRGVRPAHDRHRERPRRLERHQHHRTSRSPTATSRPTTTRWRSRATTRSAQKLRNGNVTVYDTNLSRGVLQRADVRLGDVRRLHRLRLPAHHHRGLQQVGARARLDGRRGHLRRALQGHHRSATCGRRSCSRSAPENAAATAPASAPSRTSPTTTSRSTGASAVVHPDDVGRVRRPTDQRRDLHQRQHHRARRQRHHVDRTRRATTRPTTTRTASAPGPRTAGTSVTPTASSSSTAPWRSPTTTAGPR